MKRHIIIGALILRILFIAVIVGSIVVMRASEDGQCLQLKPKGPRIVKTAQEIARDREENRRFFAAMRPYGIATLQGHPSHGSENQDSARCWPGKDGQNFYVLADGHGAEGFNVADYITSQFGLTKYFTEARGNFVRAFQAMQKRFADKSFDGAASYSGAAVVCAHVTKNEKEEAEIQFAHVGDSRALIISDKGAVLFATEDHKPDSPKEAERISKAGGYASLGLFPKFQGGVEVQLSYDEWKELNPSERPQPMQEECIFRGRPYEVGVWRVNGQLAMSRCLGDFYLDPYVSHEPEVSKKIVVPENAAFLILGCDGLFDELSHEEVAAIVLRSEDPDDAAHELVKASRAKAYFDDVTALVVDLKKTLKKGEPKSCSAAEEKRLAAKAASPSSVTPPPSIGATQKVGASSSLTGAMQGLTLAVSSVATSKPAVQSSEMA